MALLSYFKNVDRNWQRDNTGALGILLNTERGFKFYGIGTDGFNELVDAEWFKSFSCQIDIGSCTFSKEFRTSGETTKGYWYASKKINGKLRRVYFGNKIFTLDALQAALSKFTESNEAVVTQKDSCVTEEEKKPIAPGVTYELAGNGKSENHLQPNLIPVNEEIAMLKREVAHWQQCCQRDSNQIVVMNEEVRKVQRDRLKIIKERDEALKNLKKAPVEDASLVKRVQFLEEHLAFKEKEHEAEIEHFKLGHRIKSEKVEEQQKYINELLVKKDDLDYKLKRSKEKIEKLSLVIPIIEKYRDLAKGKDKRNHPRFAYLIDFLAEIDNLSL